MGVSKSEYQIAVWTGRGNVLLNPAEVREQVGELGFYVGAEARKEVEENSSIHINEGPVSLGEMSNAVGNWEPAMRAASVAAHQVACMMKKKMPNYNVMAYNLVHLILFRKCGYKIKFQSLSKKQPEAIVTPAVVEYKARLGLPSSPSSVVTSDNLHTSAPQHASHISCLSSSVPPVCSTLAASTKV